MRDGAVGLEQRAQVRRRQILEAAEACFRARGFHAAPMAEIAAGGGFSVGQIYRLFESKEAIVEAIAGQQMDELADLLAGVESPDDAAGAIRMLLARGFDKLCEPGAPALLLEVTAEASRNPRIAAVVREHDLGLRRAISDLLATANRDEAGARIDCPFGAEMICLVLEGLAARLIRNPALDQGAVGELRDRLLAKLLGQPGATGDREAPASPGQDPQQVVQAGRVAG